MDRDRPLWTGLNRLIVIVSVLLGLKLFAYITQEFLPIFGQVAGKLASAFFPFIVAFLIAFLLEPIVLRVVRLLHLKRPYASIVTLLLVLAALGMILFFIIARLYSELSELSISVPDYHIALSFIQQQIDNIEKYINLNPEIQSTIMDASQSLLTSAKDWATAGSKSLLGFLSALPGFFIVVVVSIVATLLVSIYFPGVKDFFMSLVPRKWINQFKTVSEDLGAAIFGYIRAMAILVSITGLTITVGLFILGNPYAVTIGVFSALLDLLPIVGTAVIFVPWIVVLFLTGSVGMAVKLLIVYAISITIRQFLEPKIMSKGIGLHPLATLVSMYVGLQLLGGYGLIIGPAIVIIYEALRKAGIIHLPRS